MTPLEELITIFSETDEVNAMKKLFNELFTDSERKDFESRWQSLQLVHQKVPQRQIAKKIRISLCKITRASKILKNKQSFFKQILDKQAQRGA